MRTFFWLIAASVLGFILWINLTSNKQSKEDDTKSSENSRNNLEISLLSDRDSAAEEVRAVATKISNLEQSIERQQTQNSIERSKLRSEYLALIKDVHSTLESINQNLENQQSYQDFDSLKSRLELLESYYQQHAADIDSEQKTSAKFTWHESSEFLVDPFGLTLTSQIKSNQFDAATDKTEYVNPHYTIPPTTTLLNATALTALVGRIPVSGNLQDPWRFKIIIGAENLAANGHKIPGLSGMLAAGTARGDLSLSCVSGNIDVATFIFSDGTIHTTKGNNNTESIFSGLGWISDEFGNPCIPGELKSNAINFLAQSTLIDAVGATAEALANAQTQSTTIGNSGDKIEAVSGDLNDYFVGYAVSESLSGVSEWITERQLSSFDAIYIPAGQSVAIHIEEPLNIEYTPFSRKVKNFENKAHSGNSIHSRID